MVGPALVVFSIFALMGTLVASIALRASLRQMYGASPKLYSVLRVIPVGYVLVGSAIGYAYYYMGGKDLVVLAVLMAVLFSAAGIVLAIIVRRDCEGQK